MQKIGFRLLLILSIHCVLLSILSAQKYYTIDEGQLLMISEPGDIMLSSAFPGEGFYTAQLGYSPIKHVAVTGSYIRDRSSTNVFRFNGESTARLKADYAAIGVGGYYFLKTKKKENQEFYLSEAVMLEQGFLFDLYAGYRYGQLENTYYENSRSIFDTHKYYLQVGAHWIFRIGTLSYALRGVRLDFDNGKAFGSLEDNELQDLFNGGIQDNAPFSFYETSFKYQIGIKHARIFTTITTSYGDSGKRPLQNRQTDIMAGIILELDHIFKKRAKKEEEPSVD